MTVESDSQIGKRFMVSRIPPVSDEEANWTFPGATTVLDGTDRITDSAATGAQIDITSSVDDSINFEAGSPAWTPGKYIVKFQAPSNSTWIIHGPDILQFQCAPTDDIVFDDSQESYPPRRGEISGKVTSCGGHEIRCEVSTVLTEDETTQSYNITFFVEAPSDAVCCDGSEFLADQKTAAKVEPQSARVIPVERPWTDRFVPGAYKFETYDRQRSIPRNGHKTDKELFKSYKIQDGGGCADIPGKVLACERLRLTTNVSYLLWLLSDGQNADGLTRCVPTGARVRFLKPYGEGAVLDLDAMTIKGKASISGVSTIEFPVFNRSDGPALEGNVLNAFNAHADSVKGHELFHREHSKAFVSGRGEGEPGLQTFFEKTIANRLVDKLKKDYGFDGGVRSGLHALPGAW